MAFYFDNLGNYKGTFGSAFKIPSANTPLIGGAGSFPAAGNSSGPSNQSIIPGAVYTAHYDQLAYYSFVGYNYANGQLQFGHDD